MLLPLRSAVIAVSLLVMKKLVQNLIYGIGYYTKTVQLSKTLFVEFICIFFNTGFILILTNADMSAQPFLG